MKGWIVFSLIGLTLSIGASARPQKQAQSPLVQPQEMVGARTVVTNPIVNTGEKTKLKTWNKAKKTWICYCGGVGEVDCGGGQMCAF